MPVASAFKMTVASQARRGLATLVALVFAAGMTTRAVGGAYSVDPVRVSLSARAPLASIMVRADAKLFVPHTVRAHSLASAARPTLPPIGAFLNYDILGTRIAGRTQASALLEGNLFGPLGSALIRFLEQETEGAAHGIRLEMAWPGEVTSMRCGRLID